MDTEVKQAPAPTGASTVKQPSTQEKSGIKSHHPSGIEQVKPERIEVPG
jgi:hypothetical protein